MCIRDSVGGVLQGVAAEPGKFRTQFLSTGHEILLKFPVNGLPLGVQGDHQSRVNPQGVTGQGDGFPLIQRRTAYEIPGAWPGVALGELDVPGL